MMGVANDMGGTVDERSGPFEHGGNSVKVFRLVWIQWGRQANTSTRLGPVGVADKCSAALFGKSD